MMGARVLRTVGVIAWMAAGLGGCDPSDPCDPGYREVHGACYKDAPPRDASVGMTDAEDDGGAESPSHADLYEYFGDGCNDESGCPEALVCGAPDLPMCTQVNCLDDETLCPPDWQCTDISAFSPDPNVASICLKM